MSLSSFQQQSGSFQTQKPGTKGRSITDIVTDTPVPSDYIWIDYPVKKEDYLWKIMRKNWNWPEGHNREIGQMVAMVRKQNKKTDDWNPRRTEVIRIPIIKKGSIQPSAQYNYTWDSSGENVSGVNSPGISSTSIILPTNYEGMELSQEEVNQILLMAVPTVVARTYQNVRKAKNWSMGLSKMVFGTMAVVGGIVLIGATAGMAAPLFALVAGTSATTLGITTAGLGMAQVIATGAGDLDAADRIGVYKNAGHAIGLSFDKALGTDYLHSVGNVTNILANTASGVAKAPKLMGKAWACVVGIVSASMDVAGEEITEAGKTLGKNSAKAILKHTALYKISQNPELLADPKMVEAASWEMEKFKDSFGFINKGLSMIERAIVQEVEQQKYLLRKRKYEEMLTQQNH